MKSTGVVRSVDKMGRVVIPKEIRNLLDIKDATDSLEIFMENDSIILKKYQPTCLFCNSLKESVNIDGRVVCVDCIEKLNRLKEEVCEE